MSIFFYGVVSIDAAECRLTGVKVTKFFQKLFQRVIFSILTLMKNAIDGVEDALREAVIKSNFGMEFKIDSVYRDGMVAMRRSP